MGPDCWSQLSSEKRSLCHNQALNKTRELWQYNEQLPKDIRPWIRCIFRHQQIKQLILKAHNSLLRIISIIHKISLWQQADAKRPLFPSFSSLSHFEAWAAFQLLTHPLITKLSVPSVGSPLLSSGLMMGMSSVTSSILLDHQATRHWPWQSRAYVLHLRTCLLLPGVWSNHCQKRPWCQLCDVDW